MMNFTIVELEPEFGQKMNDRKKRYKVIFENHVPVGFGVNKELFYDENDMGDHIDSFRDGDNNCICIGDDGNLYEVMYMYRGIEGKTAAIWQRCMEV